MNLNLYSKRRRAGGFTLVELLACVAIFGVLLAILLPAYSSIKQRAMVSKGVSNQRQITASYLMYINDNKGVLWFREAGGNWSGGSGLLSGPQNYANAPGYLCYLLESYDLTRAEWTGWKVIPNRDQTVWYSPPASHLDEVAGHGSSYFYTFIGDQKGDTLFAVADEISTTPYLRDYYGNYESRSEIYSSEGGSALVYSYLDGHTEYREPERGED